MHTIIQRGADVKSLLQSYDKHSYGAISGVLRISTMYTAITLIIERNLITKPDWNLIIVPYLLKEFGKYNIKKRNGVHRVYGKHCSLTFLVLLPLSNLFHCLGHVLLDSKTPKQSLFLT